MASTPPPLMKKHSQTDLVSRLKSRKVLGVGGEDDDGEVHRSKVTSHLPASLYFTSIAAIHERELWLLISAVLFTSTSLMALAFPSQLYEIIFEITTSRISIRLYGGALLCMFSFMGLGLEEEIFILFFFFSPTVTSITLLEMGTLSNGAIVLLLSETFFLFVTLSYYHHLGRRSKKI
uniref:Tumor protein p53-inducible protein 11 n=1 Tax=Sinocyclocheilus grahami TaxID=75366 RepID=A0A672QE31_SINGR